MPTPKRICIIGAGPAGLAALSTILSTPQHQSGLWKVTAYEARRDLGGIWLPGPPSETPLYDALTTNLPHPIMSFKSFPFPPSTPVFPHAGVVLEYLRAYARRGGVDLREWVEFGREVCDVRWAGERWVVYSKASGSVYGIGDDAMEGQQREEEFDVMIIANGHFRVPRYPDPQLPGLQTWLQNGTATHAIGYRNPLSVLEGMQGEKRGKSRGKKVVVVGGGPSGFDIASELSASDVKVIHSIVGGKSEDAGNLRKRGKLAAFLDGGKVLFENGEVEEEVDHCILATGYQFSYPFLSSILSPDSPPSLDSFSASSHPEKVSNSTYNLHPLALHLFPLQTTFPPGSMAFMGLTLRGIPLSLFETQARAICRVISDSSALDIPSALEENQARYEQLHSEFGGDDKAVRKLWHKLTELESFEYRDKLNAFSGSEERVEEWEREMWEKKVLLRRVWRDLEADGEADAWVDGVGGREGNEEWVRLLRTLIRRGGCISN